MTDETQPATSETGEGGSAAPQMAVLAQFLRDLSFENPNPLVMLQLEERPKIDADVDVQARRITEEQFEVHLIVNVKALKAGTDEAAFIVESVYAGVFQIRNVPDEHLEAFLLVECARLLFPFARNIVSEATRDGGFPPLMLDPIDFLSLYKRKLEARVAESQKSASDADTMGPAEGTA